ncbi:MAG: NAD(P)-binding domain-containing protein [Myxococcales bacterium]|jgi:hypothetical protein|nr:NAD(P)-binding domain-containing protein [Myxococcales bacterium]
MATVAVLGSGTVGQTLAVGFKRHGHTVVIASREGNKLGAWSAAEGIAERPFAAALEGADIAVLAVQGGVAEALVKQLAAGLEGKVVLDATNPISGAPDKGILPFFTSLSGSLMEQLQRAAPGARFVKCFSCVGAAKMVNPDFGGTRPTMFIAGDDAGAKATTVALLDAFGWDAEDLGGVEGARAIEPLCITWCAPGFLRNSWGHAFKVLR